ncbi:hypothetical protein D9M69_668120 [compost metagenome]
MAMLLAMTCWRCERSSRALAWKSSRAVICSSMFNSWHGLRGGRLAFLRGHGHRGVGRIMEILRVFNGRNKDP